MTISTAEAKWLDEFITAGLAEDIGVGDHTSLACIPSDLRSKAKLLVKEPGVLAGVRIAELIFKKVDETAVFKSYIEGGADISRGDIAFEVECNAQALLKAERLVLNTMQRMSGIATQTNRFAFEVEDLPVTLLDTRKTTPLIRTIEKRAVRLGGGTNYRWGLYDWVMIKDNHIDACGGIQQALERVAAYQAKNKFDLNVTIEVRNLVELYQALEAGKTSKITRIMLDNFEIPLLHEAVAIVDKSFETEASGGVNIHTVRKIAKSGVDFISVGALTHSAIGLDLSLKIIK